jgi:outer membrane protein assembly factor BamA
MRTISPTIDLFFFVGNVLVLYTGDPAGVRGKPGHGYGYGAGLRVDSPLGPLRLEYAFNDSKARRFHFGIGYRN